MAHAVSIAALPEPFRILGLSLLPLSLGRFRLLQRFDCAFVSDDDAQATIADLLLGVSICSMPVRDCVDWIYSKPEWFPRGILRRPWYQPGAARDLARWGRRIQQEIASDEMFDITAKCKLFSRYLSNACTIPPAYNNHSGDRSGAHWSHSIEVALRSKLGWTQSEVEEEPLSKAISDYFRWAEQEGLITLISEADLKQGESNNAALESLAKSMEESHGA